MGRLLKENERGCIYAEIDKKGRKVIKRVIEKGSADVYELLMNNPHPYMPIIFSVNCDEKSVIVSEEFIEGKMISEACFTENSMVNAAKELCRILVHIHRLGIVHRDIKPSNILLADDGHIRLIDFDAARTVKPAADSDTRYLGTEGFAPPEQYGFSQTDKRSDIYALGKTLECILGSLAFDKKYADIIYKCTRLDPDNRYSDASEVLRDLNSRRQPVTAMIMLAVLVLGLISGAIISLNNDPDSLSADDLPSADETMLISESASETLQTKEITVTHISEAEPIETPTEKTSEAPRSETSAAETGLTEAAYSAVSQTAITAEEADPFSKYRSYYKNLDFDKAVRIPTEEMEKPLLFETINDIPMEYIIIDTASLKENKYASMLYDYNKDGYDDLFQLSAYNPEGQDEYFRSLCVSVVSMANDYPDFHVISDNTYFPVLISTLSMNQETAMLYDNRYVQLTVVDINHDERNEIILSIGKPGVYINMQIFAPENTGLEYSSSMKLNTYASCIEKAYYDGKMIYDKENNLRYMDFENTLSFYKATDLNLYMYEKEDDPLYQFHKNFASIP
ncbi:MAG: protein kinase [Oscillospiraceae bacterium]|nr:protein kinase [Oscillospiraceae bacterium]